MQFSRSRFSMVVVLAVAVGVLAVGPGIVHGDMCVRWDERNLRVGHAMAYDSARGVTVLFGGADATGV